MERSTQGGGDGIGKGHGPALVAHLAGELRAGRSADLVAEMTVEVRVCPGSTDPGCTPEPPLNPGRFRATAGP